MYLVGWGLRTNLKFKDIMVTCTSAETYIWHKATEGGHKVGINNWGSGKIYIWSTEEKMEGQIHKVKMCFLSMAEREKLGPITGRKAL